MTLQDDTKSRLLDAAGRVFADKGFEAATVREICQLADANIAAVNYHFGDKERLYLEAVSEAQCARADRAPLPTWPEDMPPEERLRLFIRVFLTRLIGDSRPHWHLGLMLRELAFPTAACAHVVHDYIQPMAEVLRHILSDILPNVPPRELHLTSFSIVGQCLFHYINRPIIKELVGESEFSTYDVDLLSEHISRFSLAALAGLTPHVPHPSAGVSP